MIYLTQLLCPLRHCIIAVAWDAKETTQAEAEEGVAEFVKSVKIEYRCGLCGSHKLACETRPTHFTTLEQAREVLKEYEALQAVTREALNGIKDGSTHH